MATVHIDRLLETCIRLNSSDIHLHVGRPPVLRMDGRLRSLETKVLEPDDCMALMKSITPERNQQEFQEEGGTRLRFRVWREGPLPCFRVPCQGQRLDRAAAHSQPHPHVRGNWPAADGQGALPPAAWHVPGHRTDRVGQDDDAGDDARLRQPQFRPAHHHRRGPDRVLPSAPQVDLHAA